VGKKFTDMFKVELTNVLELDASTVYVVRGDILEKVVLPKIVPLLASIFKPVGNVGDIVK